MRAADPPGRRAWRAAPQQGGDRGAPGAPAHRRLCGREGPAVAGSERGGGAGAPAGEAGAAGLSATSAAQDAADPGLAGEEDRGEAQEGTEEEGPPVGGMSCAAVLAAVVTTAVATTTATATAEKAQERFLYLLRTYPQRPPREPLAQVEKLG